jgi:hypothetical protein
MIEQEADESFHKKKIYRDEYEVAIKIIFFSWKYLHQCFLQVLLLPFSHITQKGFERKSVSARMWRAFNHWLNVPRDKFKQIASVLERMFSAALLYTKVFIK